MFRQFEVEFPASGCPAAQCGSRVLLPRRDVAVPDNLRKAGVGFQQQVGNSL